MFFIYTCSAYYSLKFEGTLNIPPGYLEYGIIYKVYRKYIQGIFKVRPWGYESTALKESRGGKPILGNLEKIRGQI